MGQSAGILLAGGHSRRMGHDKALLTIPGAPRQTFLEHLVTLLTAQCDEVFVVARDAVQAEQYAGLVPSSVRVITDKISAVGPLMGLYSGLSVIQSTHALVSAVDTPLLQPALISYLLAQPREDTPLVPLVGGVPQVLLAVYPRKMLPLIEARLHAGRRDPRSLLEGTPVRFLPEEQLRAVDPQLRSFVNVNTPEELAGLI